MADDSPKLFISYSWSSDEHVQRVLGLATELRDNGVDVILDKWELREGHDAYAFMERIVSDSEVQKVILVCDEVYARKANERSGGVGTETQIISPEIYASQQQDKFVAVVFEKDETNTPYLPVYYKSRIYIDLSDPDRYATNFEQLLRWVYGKPVYIKPELGKKPAFLDESTAINLGTSTKFRRALDALRNSKSYARGAVSEYFDSVVENLERFRLSGGEGEFDDLVHENIEQFLPYRNEAIELFAALAQYQDFSDTSQLLHHFFERLIPYMHRPVHIAGHFHDGYFDNFRFIIHELFLYAVASLLKYESFETVGHLVRTPYYAVLPDRGTTIPSFSEMRQHLRSFERRNQRLGLRRLSLRADLLKQRAEAFGFEFKHLMQADFVLYLRSCLDAARTGEHYSYWWPETLVYIPFGSREAFEVFLRAQSKRYFDKLCPIFDVAGKQDFDSLIQLLQENPRMMPGWQGERHNPAILMGYEKLATTS